VSKRTVPYLLVDVFTAVAGGGNRVALVLDAHNLNSEEIQLVAAQLEQPQAALCHPPEGMGFEVRFFTANGEVEFSGHAAVALALTLLHEGLLSTGSQEDLSSYHWREPQSRAI
jgi:PhzF family phenazine biosynthesis protein